MEIFKNMMKEEWRIHSTMFGGKTFAFFPIMLLIFSFINTLFLPFMRNMLSLREIVYLAHYIFLVAGFSVGTFGILGRDVMNRRFGETSLIIFSSKNLPLSERRLLFNFLLKDVLYYFILWILPFISGFGIASPLLSIPYFYTFLLLITLSLSFLIGLSISFFLSILFIRSRNICLAAVAVGISSILYFLILYGAERWYSLLEIFPPLEYFLKRNPLQILFSVSIIFFLSLISIILIKTDYPGRKRGYSNSFDNIASIFGFTRYSPIIAKDFLDLKRSEGGMGKVVFSFLLPIMMVWFLFYIFMRALPSINFPVIFSIFLGIISPSIYNWLTEFESLSTYKILPLKISMVMKSKVMLYSIFNILPIAIIVTTIILFDHALHIFPVIIAFASLSFYSLSITVYLMGLHPNILIYNPKIFLLYSSMIIPFTVIFTLLTILNVYFLAFTFPLLLLAFYILKYAYNKWDAEY